MLLFHFAGLGVLAILPLFWLVKIQSAWDIFNNSIEGFISVFQWQINEKMDHLWIGEEQIANRSKSVSPWPLGPHRTLWRAYSHWTILLLLIKQSLAPSIYWSTLSRKAVYEVRELIHSVDTNQLGLILKFLCLMLLMSGILFQNHMLRSIWKWAVAT